ncbi:DUF421 domain-containing protein [Dehalobacterium formicoaceticum]|uniref:DUF421 domain-containing protein n=1 Tax=Dehalobacterium formicoaceticum TaxID=51515 RepID=A0ABT1Y5W1_9FIRM|nr:DUF421 domain-containing protein [Dehalobacterium formicoaceticum]MCR6546269.1 DUF421 domain-containing protein [Dehalobacterium formicoaceticum]
MEWLEIIWRTILVIIILFTLTKLLGKRQLGQLSYFEYITGITIGSIAAYVSMDLDITWYYGILAMVVWTAVVYGLESITLKSKFVRDIIDGKGVVLIKDGKIMEDNLTKLHLTADDLLEEMRGKNVFKVADVEFAVLEANGKFNVLLNKENQPLTPKDLGLKTVPEREPQTVIIDGKIMDEPLATIGLSREWLHTELDKIGVAIENVFLGQVDAYGELFVDCFDDKIKIPQPQQKALLLATLKKCEADIEMFGLSSNNSFARKMYQECSEQLQNVIASLYPILSR